MSASHLQDLGRASCQCSDSVDADTPVVTECEIMDSTAREEPTKADFSLKLCSLMQHR